MNRLAHAAILCSLLASPALAQTAPQPPAAAPSEYAMKLTKPQLDVIWKGLGKLPAEESFEVMATLRVQFNALTAPKPVEAQPADTPAEPTKN